MKDIDFDELDRAVSSLMGSVPKDSSAKTTDGPNVEATEDTATVTVDEPQYAATTEADDTPKADDDVMPAVSMPELIENDEPEPESAQPLPRPVASPPPSRGRFMDVVRPSREMRQSSFSGSRQGVTLQPSVVKHPMEPTDPPQEEATYPSEEVSNASLTVTDEVEDTANVTSKIDMSASDTLPTVESSSFIETEDNAPLSSPFLADAKVEKRPLGRLSENIPSAGLEDESEEDNNSTPTSAPELVTPMSDQNGIEGKDAQLPEDPLPAELDSKILSIETDTTMQHLEVPSTPSPAVETLSAPATESTEKTTSAIDVPRAMAAASIPQQYKLDNGAKEDLPASAIYDTQPLAHPAKSKPGWLLIAAILGILVLGVALGAVVYYLGII